MNRNSKLGWEIQQEMQIRNLQQQAEMIKQGRMLEQVDMKKEKQHNN